MITFIRVCLAFGIIGALGCILVGWSLGPFYLVWIGVGLILQACFMELFVRLCENVAAIKKTAEDRSYDIIDRLEKLLKQRGNP